MANYSGQNRDLDSWWRDRGVRPQPQKFQSYDDNPYLPLPLDKEDDSEYGLEYIERPLARERFAGQATYPRHFQQDNVQIPGNVGPHAGKGPRHYQRSDETIMEEINDDLLRNSWIDATDLDIRSDGGVVTISGSVMDRRMKHMVMELVEDTPGVVDVISHLRVQKRQ